MSYLGNPPVTGDSNNSFRILDSISSYTQTFDGSSSAVVSTANSTFTFAGHRFVTGQRVTYSTTGTTIGGLSSGSVYYIIKTDQNTLQLANSYLNSLSSTSITLTSLGVGSTHTLNVAFDGVNKKFKATFNNGSKGLITRAAQLNISINGVIQQPQDTATPPTGFGIEADSTIVFPVAPAVSDAFWGSLVATNFATFDISDNTVDSFTGDSSQVNFTLSKTPANNQNVLVTINGVVQYPSDATNIRAYSVSGNVLIFTGAPGSGSLIQVRHIGFAGATSSSVTGFYGRTGNVGLTTADTVSIGAATIGVGGIGTSLLVQGNARITGILTIGTGSITFDGNTNTISGVTQSDISNTNVTGIATFSNGPVLIGSGTSTGTAGQVLQATGGAYVSGSVGIGTTNPQAKLHVVGDAYITGVTTSLEFVGGGSDLRNLSGTHLVSYASHSETSNSALSIAGISTYNQVGILTGSYAVDVNDTFGFSVATSADGKTIVVGAQNDEIGANNASGVVYVYDRVGNSFNQVGILTGSYAVDASDFFGRAVATSADGKTIIVGAPSDEIGATTGTGVVYVYDRVGSSFNQVGILTGSLAVDVNDTFGFSVATSADGKTIIVGAYLDEIGATLSTGVVYVYDRVGSSFNQVGILTGSLAVDANDNFGISVATSADGKTIIVGAYDDEIGANNASGVVYVFNREGNSFNQVGILTGSLAVDASDFFGRAVATSADGKTIIVGAYQDEIGATTGTGVVYVYDQTRDTYVYSGPTGNIGIGTTNPTEKLSVLGKIQIIQDSSSNNRLTFRGQPSSFYRWNIDNYSSSNDFRIYREDDATAANGVTYVGVTTTGNFQFNSGYGSVATSYGCRAWVNFNGTTATPSTIRGSGNVSSVTKNGTGDYTVNFTTALADANYTFAGSDNSWGIVQQYTTQTTTACRHVFNNGSGVAGDRSVCCVNYFR